jgi:hypothetical protein
MAMSAPGVAPADSFETQHTALDHPILGNGLNHVLATGGSKSAACRKQRRYDILVDQNWKYGYLSHGYETFVIPFGRLHSIATKNTQLEFL